MDERRITPSPFCGVLWREKSVCVFFIFVLDKMEQKWTIAGLPLSPFCGVLRLEKSFCVFFIFVLDN